MEENECFRRVTFALNKKYEYVYATRKSFEYISSLMRSDYRYFTTSAYIYLYICRKMEGESFHRLWRWW